MDNKRLLKKYTNLDGEVDMVAVIKERKRLAKEYRIKYRAENKHKSDKNILARYKRSASSRKLQFNLDNELFFKLLHNNCKYCDTPESLGVDRINSKLGYIETNVVSCCSMCNKMKFTFTSEEFIQQCKRIVQNS